MHGDGHTPHHHHDAPSGLRTPHGGALAVGERPRRWTARTVILQIVGFLISAALLVWAITTAFSPDNREGIDRLLDASWGPIAALFGLSMVSLLVNGLVFYFCVLPVRRVPWPEMVGVNAIASLLAYLPFKLSILIRVVIHRQRHRMPFKEIFAMLGVNGVVLGGVLGPLAGAGVLLAGLDVPWWLIGGGGVFVGVGVSVALGELLLRYRWLDHLSLGAGRMLRSKGAVTGQAAMRLADVGAQAGRFLVAASIIGATLPLADAVLLASTYFLVGMLSPAGNLGTREAAVTGLGTLGLVLAISQETAALLALIITATEIITNGVFGVIAGVWLRVDRLITERRKAHEAYSIDDTTHVGERDS